MMNPQEKGGGDELSPMTRPLRASFRRSSSISANVVAPARRLPLTNCCHGWCGTLSPVH